MSMKTLRRGLCLALGLVALSSAPALAQNSDTPGRGTPAAPGVYGPSPGSPPMVAIFHDREPGSPWDGGVLAPITQILQDQGVGWQVYTSAEMGTADLSPFSKVITTSVQPVAFWDALAANRSRFEAYVQAGGILELHLASFSSETNTGTVFPGGFVVYHIWNNYNSVRIEDASHRILRAPNRVMETHLQDWNWSAHGYFSTVPGGATPIIRETETGNVVAAELVLGSGKILATVQPVEWDLANTGYRQNIVLYRPHAQVEVSLVLVGCVVPVPAPPLPPPVRVPPLSPRQPTPQLACRVGDTVTALVTVSNTGLTGFPVEVKGGVKLPDGTPVNLLRDRHIEVPIPPGITGPLPILEVVIPPEAPPGEYTAEGALLTPALGRELSRSQVNFTVLAP